MKIPKTFRLGGRTWHVKRGVKMRKSLGKCHPFHCLIEISSNCRDKEEEKHTFLHELMHAIAYTMAWEKLFNDEEGIDGIASLLLQVLTTSR